MKPEKRLFIVIRNDGLLIAGNAAEEEARSFPGDVVWSGEVSSVSHVEELVKFAVGSSFRSGLEMGRRE